MGAIVVVEVAIFVVVEGDVVDVIDRVVLEMIVVDELKLLLMM